MKYIEIIIWRWCCVMLGGCCSSTINEWKEKWRIKKMVKGKKHITIFRLIRVRHSVLQYTPLPPYIARTVFIRWQFFDRIKRKKGHSAHTAFIFYELSWVQLWHFFMCLREWKNELSLTVCDGYIVRPRYVACKYAIPLIKASVLYWICLQ